MRDILKNFRRDERGQNLIEYTLLIGFVALVAVAIFSGLGGSIAPVWANTDTQLSAAADSANPHPIGGRRMGN